MFKIVRIPRQLESFFMPLEGYFHWDRFSYFRMLVLVMAIAWGRHNISALYRQVDNRQVAHRTRFNNFLNVSRFDAPAALEQKVYELLLYLRLKKGATIYFIIDDSKKSKRGRKMDGVGKMKDPVTGAYIRGHQYVQAILYVNGYTIPFGIRLYVPKDQCEQVGVLFQKTTQLATELIRAFQAPEGIHVKVLFDSYYLCKNVVKACREKGYRFVSTLKGNRNLFKNGRKLKAGKYGKNYYRRHTKQHLSVQKEQGQATYSYVDAGTFDVSDLGSLHVVFSKRGKEKQILGIVTDDETLTPEQIIQIYGYRWTIEVFFKDTKQLLGLGQYQNVSYKAAVTHLHLVCFAYALLTHLRIQSDSEKGKQKKAKAERVSTATLQNDLRRVVWNDLVTYLNEEVLAQHEEASADTIIQELDYLLAV